MKIGFNCSTLDLFHVGHVTMLREEKRHCDYLIVALQTDPTIDRPNTKNKPVQSVYERYMQLSACKYVDEVICYSTEEDLLNLLKTVHIDIRFLGDEYKTKEFTGKQWCLDHGIELHYHEREHPFSSSALRKRVWQAENERLAKAREAGMIMKSAEESERIGRSVITANLPPNTVLYDGPAYQIDPYGKNSIDKVPGAQYNDYQKNVEREVDRSRAKQFLQEGLPTFPVREEASSKR